MDYLIFRHRKITLKQAADQIVLWAGYGPHGVQDDEIKLFIDAVAMMSGLEHESEKREHLFKLRSYFEHKQDALKEYLIKKYGRGAARWGNSIHYALYGTPWPFELVKGEGAKTAESAAEKAELIKKERIDIYNIVNAIKEYYQDNKHTLLADMQVLQEKRELAPSVVARIMYNGIVSRVQAIVEGIKNAKELEIIESQKKLIWGALNEIWGKDIYTDNIRERLKLDINKNSSDRFAEPIYQAIMADIEDRLEKLRAAA